MRTWIETDRKISQGRWTEGQQKNNQKLHESGVEVEKLETLLTEAQKKKRLFAREHRH